MNALYSYIDFLVKSFDVKSKTSRKCYWVVFAINATLSVILTSIGVIVPQGRPLEIYIGVSSIIATPLFVPFFTVIARRLNDIDMRRSWMCLLLIPGFGLIPILIFCSLRSKYDTREDFTVYQNQALFTTIKKFTSVATTIFPYIHLIYTIYQLAIATDTFGVGLNASMLSINFVICVFTVFEIKTKRFGKFLSVWKVIKSLTVLSSAILSIIFYRESQNFINAFFTVYLYFYVMIEPVLLISNTYKIFKKDK